MDNNQRFHTGGIVPKQSKDTEKSVLIKAYNDNLNLPNKELIIENKKDANGRLIRKTQYN